VRRGPLAPPVRYLSLVELMAKPTPLITSMAQFVANMPPSVTRGSPPGVYKRVNEFLRGNALLIIERLVKPDTFLAQLDRLTEELCDCPDVKWGAARKSINIFIRDAVYNFCLRNHFQLEKIEDQLEVPLDSFTTSNLRRAAQQGKLPEPPRWESIRALTPADSRKYQELAACIARDRQIHRCHLDALYWRVDPEPGPKAAERKLRCPNATM
jgi:hypothetical protein